MQHDGLQVLGARLRRESVTTDADCRKFQAYFITRGINGARNEKDLERYRKKAVVRIIFFGGANYVL
jgi:hypothetical protein